MTSHKRFTIGRHELVLSHDPEDGSISAEVRRGCDPIARVTAYGPGAMLGAGLELCPNGASEAPVRLHLHALLFRLYLSAGGELAEIVASLLTGGRELEAGLDAARIEGTDGPDVMISGALFAERWHARKSDPRFAFMLRDVVLGRLTVELRTVDVQVREVPLPEGVYEVSFIRYERTEQRARVPFRRRSYQVTADKVVRGPGGENFIPVPGKHSGWYGKGLAAETIDDAVAELVADVLEQRRVYGGAAGVRWRPPVPTPEAPPPIAAA